MDQTRQFFQVEVNGDTMSNSVPETNWYQLESVDLENGLFIFRESNEPVPIPFSEIRSMVPVSTDSRIHNDLAERELIAQFNRSVQTAVERHLGQWIKHVGVTEIVHTVEQKLDTFDALNG